MLYARRTGVKRNMLVGAHGYGAVYAIERLEELKLVTLEVGARNPTVWATGSRVCYKPWTLESVAEQEAQRPEGEPKPSKRDAGRRGRPKGGQDEADKSEDEHDDGEHGGGTSVKLEAVSGA